MNIKNILRSGEVKSLEEANFFASRAEFFEFEMGGGDFIIETDFGTVEISGEEREIKKGFVDAVPLYPQKIRFYKNLSPNFWGFLFWLSYTVAEAFRLEFYFNSDILQTCNKSSLSSGQSHENQSCADIAETNKQTNVACIFILYY